MMFSGRPDMRTGREMAMIRSFVYGVLNTNAYLMCQDADTVLVDPPDDTATSWQGMA